MKSSLPVLLMLSALSGCSHFPCDVEKVSDTASPNHQLTATVVHVGCGAMAKDATSVTLHRTGEKWDSSDDMVLTVVEEQPIEVSWVDDNHLNLHCRCGDGDVTFQVIKRAGIDISYK